MVLKAKILAVCEAVVGVIYRIWNPRKRKATVLSEAILLGSVLPRIAAACRRR
jgi:hypothetical protein